MTDIAQRVGIVERGLLLGERTGFSVELGTRTRAAELSLVIDVYDFDNPVHPEGHLGWWSFPLAALDLPAQVQLSLADGNVTINGQSSTASWSNPDFAATSRLVVNAVLRSATTNAIVDLDRVPAFTDPADLAALRAGFDRDWSAPRYAPVQILPAAGETVHIVAPDLALRDGVGNLCLELYRHLRQNNVPVMLHAARADFAIGDLVSPYKALPERVGAADRVIYFYSTHDPLLGLVTGLDCRSKAAYFHGVTDPARVRVFDPELAAACSKALAGLDALADFDRLAANSRHSAKILSRALPPARQREVAVVPPLLAASGSVVDDETHSRAPVLLTVCQIRPHKRVEDVLRLFAEYRRLVPEARLHVVGRAPSRPYMDYLAWVQVDELGLPPDAVMWLGSIAPDELAAQYRAAALYVSMSEDEGFCLPLFEAMRHRLPVAAFALPAVLETLGGAGLVFGDKDFPLLAGQLAAMLADAGRREALAAAGAARAAQWLAAMDGTGLVELVYGTGSG